MNIQRKGRSVDTVSICRKDKDDPRWGLNECSGERGVSYERKRQIGYGDGTNGRYSL